ncbi:glycosyltransferase [Rhizobium panacihumi]|uniref:glycosyltransferase n=1 Tax=Rhizobium panacihumi TaxID=2008450 RepID=UPI003D7A7BC8
MSEFDITVVVPTFKSEKVIGQCLQSILSQSGAETEIVVIDGASPDNTLAIVHSFKTAKINVISEPDRGVYDAINKGVARSRGRMIGVLGSDDVYCEGTLATVKDNMRQGSGIIAGLTEIDGVIRADEPYGQTSLISGIPFGHNSMFASRETYDKVGFYDLNYRICADAQWVHRAIKADIPCLKVERTFVRFGTGGLSSTNPDEIMAEAYRVIQENFPFLTMTEAKQIMYAYRKWGGQDALPDLMQKYRMHSKFVETMRDAFPTIGSAAPATTSANLFHKISTYLMRRIS